MNHREKTSESFVRPHFMQGIDYTPALVLDDRRRHWLAYLLSIVPIERTLEIGSGEGRSAPVFFDAKCLGAPFESHHCDCLFTPASRTVFSRHPMSQRVMLHEVPTPDFYRERHGGSLRFVFLWTAIAHWRVFAWRQNGFCGRVLDCSSVRHNLPHSRCPGV